MKQVCIIVTGRVQGVFFRASACEYARRLKLRGYAGNLPNGGVEILGAGDEEALQKLVEWTKIGPPGALVEDMTVTWQDKVTWGEAGFSVRY